jgi:hypothetical protein
MSLDVAVVPAVGQLHRLAGFRQRKQFAGPVVAVAGDKANAAALGAGEHAIPVELDFVEPVVVVLGRCIHERCELGLQLRG